VTWWPWRRELERSQEALHQAERLRDTAQEQQRQAERIAPRVAAVSSSLQKLRTDNHFGPLIDSILRGSE
jgi:hypothetical protein